MKTLFKVVFYTALMKKFGCNCYMFQKIVIYNANRHSNKWQCQWLRLNIKCQNIKILPHIFYFLNGKYIWFHLFISCYIIVETVCKMKLNTLVTKYTDILIFKYAYLSSAMHNATLTLTFQWDRNFIEVSQQNIHWETGLFKRIIRDSYYYCTWKKVLDVCIYILTGNIKDEIKKPSILGYFPFILIHSSQLSSVYLLPVNVLEGVSRLFKIHEKLIIFDDIFSG